MLLLVLCNFSVRFGKLFLEKFAKLFGVLAQNIIFVGITATTATLKFVGGCRMATAVREESQICLFVKREIDDYGLDPYEFRLYARISRRASNGGAWESLYKVARACCVGLSRARKPMSLLNLTEITP